MPARSMRTITAMSDEPAKDVSPLRLKRPGASAPLSPEAGSPPAQPEPAPAAPSAETSGDAPPGAGRRRPTLSTDALSAGITGDTLIGGPAGSGSPPLPPVTPPDAPAAPIKLRVGAKAPPPPAPILPNDPFPPTESGAPLVPLPGLPKMDTFAPLPPLPGQATPPPLPGARPPGTAEIGGGGPAVTGVDKPLMPLAMAGGSRPAFPTQAGQTRPEAAKASKKHAAGRDLLVFALVLVLLGAVGAGAWFYLKKPGESAAALAGVKQKLQQAAELPGKAVDNAKNSLAGARGAEQSRVDNIAEGKDEPGARGVPARTPAEVEARLRNADGAAPAPARPVEPAKPNQVETGPVQAYAGGETAATPAATAGAPVPSARFVRFAESLSVSGVFQGTPARALVNGRLVRTGDLVDPMLGVKFVGVDPDTKHLILQETGGAELRVKY